MIIALLIVIIAVALFIRVYLPYDFVFGDFIRFYGVDSYKIMATADLIIKNHTTDYNLWEYIISLGKSDFVAVWLPPLFSGITIITTFFIGKILFNKWVGIISAALLATFGGEYMARSLLGAVDYHCFEVFLTTVMVLFIVLAVKKHRLFIMGAGFFYGLYVVTWQGAILFALIFNIWLFSDFARKHIKGEDLTPSLITGMEFYAVAMVVIILSNINISRPTDYTLIACLLFPVVLYIISYAMRNIHRYYYPAALVLFLFVGAGLSYIIIPDLWHYYKDYAIYMFGWSNSTIGEESPLFLNHGHFTLAVMWFNFGIALILAKIGAVALHRDGDKSYLLIWFAVVLLITLALRRFTYYLAVPVALLAGYLSHFMITVATRPYRVAIAGLLVCVLFIPNIANATRSTGPQDTYYSDDWHKATVYLKNHTLRKYFNVMSWADYGYWLEREAKIGAVCTPAQGEDVVIAAEYFTTDDINRAFVILWRNQSPYIVVDKDMVTNKFDSIAIRASSPVRYQSDGYEQTIVYRLYNGQLDGYDLLYQAGDIKIFQNNEIINNVKVAIFRSNIGYGTQTPIKTPFRPTTCLNKPIVE